MKKSIFIFFFLMNVSLFAEDSDQFFLEESEIDSDYITRAELVEYVHQSFDGKNQKCIVYPRSFTLPLQKGHIFIGGEYLYWKPYAFIPFAVSFERANTSPTFLTNEIIPQLSLKARSGYRVSLGFYLPRCTWYAEAQYTQFFARGGDFLDSLTPSGFASVGGTRFFCPWTAENLTSGNNGLRDASATERVRLKIIDGILSRTFTTNSCFTFDPFFGVRYARIKVDMNIFYKQQQSQGIFTGQFGTNEIDLTNDFNSFGLRVGLKANWLLGCGFEAFGDGSFSTLAGTFVLRNRQNIVRINNNDIVFRTLTYANNKKDIYNNFQIALGLIWGAHFKCKYFGLKVGYEMNVWSDFLRLTKEIDPDIDTGIFTFNTTHRNHLSMHGLIASARFDF